jgi:hypothetical protein
MRLCRIVIRPQDNKSTKQADVNEFVEIVNAEFGLRRKNAARQCKQYENDQGPDDRGKPFG